MAPANARARGRPPLQIDQFVDQIPGRGAHPPPRSGTREQPRPTGRRRGRSAPPTAAATSGRRVVTSSRLSPVVTASAWAIAGDHTSSATTNSRLPASALLSWSLASMGLVASMSTSISLASSRRVCSGSLRCPTLSQVDAARKPGSYLIRGGDCSGQDPTCPSPPHPTTLRTTDRHRFSTRHRFSQALELGVTDQVARGCRRDARPDARAPKRSRNRRWRLVGLHGRLCLRVSWQSPATRLGAALRDIRLRGPVCLTSWRAFTPLIAFIRSQSHGPSKTHGRSTRRRVSSGSSRSRM